MKQLKYNYFYKITNNLNNHFYYGVHSTNNMDDGYIGSGRRLHYAYKKYGIENFTKEIIKQFDTAKDAYDFENEIVNETLVKDPSCYNLVKGGYGGYKEESVGKVAVRLKNDNTYKYFLITQEEYCNNKDKYITPCNWKGKHHKEESKDKTRNKMTPINSNNDRIWVNKNGVVKYLLKKYLDEYIENGWTLGRTGYKPRKGCQGKII